jgi:general secretion pathway protein M
MMQFKTVLLNSFTHFWEARQQRERQYLLLAAVFFVLMLLYLIAIEPALSGREELKKSLPVLHQQAAQMQQYAQQFSALPSTDNRHEISRELIETSMSRQGLKAQTLSVNDSVVRAQFASVAMSSLQSWLLEMQKNSSLFVDEIKLSGLDGGMVSVNLVLRQTSGAGNGAS